jgi:paraquat-inducible protein B
MAGWHPRRVGGFVLAGIALLVIAVVLVGSGSVFSTKHRFVTYFSGSVSGLRVGAPVKFRGIPVGQVTGVYIALAGQVELSRIPVLFDVDERLLRSRGGGSRLGDPAFVDSLIGAGLRAELDLESFVTGQKYVSLDFFPDQPAVFVREGDVSHPEIPSITLPSVQQDLTSFIEELREADITQLVRRLSRLAARADTSVQGLRAPELRATLDSVLRIAAVTMEEIGTLARTLTKRTPPVADALQETSTRLASTLEALEATARATGETLDPESPVVVALEDALREFAAAARALRQLTEYLERNPSAVLRGRAEERQP